MKVSLRRSSLGSAMTFLLFVLGTRAAEPAFLPQFARGADGSWIVRSPAYVATIDAAGYLASLNIGTVETLAGFAYQPKAKLNAESFAVAADTLEVHLKGEGEADLGYRFREDGVTILMTWRGNGYAEFQLTAATTLLGIELLNDKSVTVGADAMRFVENGEIRGVPAVPSNRNQMVRFRFPGFGLHAYVEAWGCPYNYESAGSIRGLQWGRPLMEANKTFPIVMTVQPQVHPARLPAVPFVPRSDKVCSLYYSDEPCVWTLELGSAEARRYLTEAGISALDASWKITDFHDTPVSAGEARVPLSVAGEPLTQAVTLDLPGSGYYQVLFNLRDASGRMLDSSFLTRFTVIHRLPGRVNRDDGLVGQPISDYAVVGMIGVGGIRESHNIGGFF